MAARNEIWVIERNLRLMSEDLYFFAITCFNLPSHIKDSYKFLAKVRGNPEAAVDSN